MAKLHLEPCPVCQKPPVESATGTVSCRNPVCWISGVVNVAPEVWNMRWSEKEQAVATMASPMRLTIGGVKKYLDAFKDEDFPLTLGWYTVEAAVGTAYWLSVTLATGPIYTGVRLLAKASERDTPCQTRDRARAIYARVVSMMDAYCILRDVTPTNLMEFKA